MKVLIVVPAYNEENSILRTIDDIKTINNDNNIVSYVVINDCSTDRTKDILINHRITYIDLPVNLGIGGGIQTGYRYALENNYDIAIQFDGDGQHIASYIKNLIEPIQKGEADIVIGSRFIEYEGFQSSWSRRVGINLLSNLIKALSGVKVHDVTSGFRAINKKYIEIYAKDYAQDYPEPEALMQALILKARIREIPVTMRERQGGISSIKAWRTVYYMIKVSLSIILHRITFSIKGEH